MTNRDVLSRAASGPDVVLRYADMPEGVIDVFLPPPDGFTDGTADRPRLVVFLHGGFWREEWDRTHTRPLANDLAARGYAVATPEYRRVGGSGGWPMTGDDVAAGLVAVRGLLEAAAPGVVDPDAPVVLAGHSAGGHLALWAGLRTPSGVVERIVALAPVSDLTHAAARGVGDDAVEAFLGGRVSDAPDAYGEADVLGALASTVTPVTILQGEQDLQVPVWLNRGVAEHLADIRRPGFDYVELPGVDHFALIDPETAAWSRVVDAISHRG